MIYHVNERKRKKTSPESLFCPPHSSSLVFLLRLGYCRAHPTQQIWTNFLRLSLEIFVLFKYLMMCVASSMSTWLRIWPPWKEPKTPENNQIVKVSSTKNYSTTTRNYCYIYLHTCRIFRRWTKYKFLCQLTEREKIPKPSFAGLPTIKLKQSYYHVYVDL